MICSKRIFKRYSDLPPSDLPYSTRVWKVSCCIALHRTAHSTNQSSCCPSKASLMICASHDLQAADMLTARGALAAAHAGTRLPGSSTACVLRLNRVHGTVDTANLVSQPPPSVTLAQHLQWKLLSAASASSLVRIKGLRQVVCVPLDQCDS